MRLSVMTYGKTIDSKKKEHWKFSAGTPITRPKAVSLDVYGLTDYILSKVNIRPTSTYKKNANLCAAYILAHNGSTTGGGCPDHVKYKTKTVFHHSVGQRGNRDGCSVFFANSGGGNAILLAIGRHDRDDSGDPHYDLNWKHPGWYNGSGIQF